MTESPTHPPSQLGLKVCWTVTPATSTSSHHSRSHSRSRGQLTRSVLQQQLWACDKRVHTVHVGDSLQEGAYLHLRGSCWTLGSVAGRSALLIPIGHLYKASPSMLGDGTDLPNMWKQTQRIRHSEETEECILTEKDKTSENELNETERTNLLDYKVKSSGHKNAHWTSEKNGSTEWEL